jgi:hypothetical protein
MPTVLTIFEYTITRETVVTETGVVRILSPTQDAADVMMEELADLGKLEQYLCREDEEEDELTWDTPRERPVGGEYHHDYSADPDGGAFDDVPPARYLWTDHRKQGTPIFVYQDKVVEETVLVDKHLQFWDGSRAAIVGVPRPASARVSDGSLVSH